MPRVMTLKSFRKTVTTAGDAEPLILTPRTYAYFFRIRALSTNAGNIYWGDKDVDSNYDPLLASEFIDVEVPPVIESAHEIFDLNRIYIDADTSGEGVIVTYQAFEDA